MEEHINTSQQSDPSLTSCHLLCTSCKTTLHLNEGIFSGDGFLLKCPNCQYPVSIRNIYKQDGLNISELFGCKYIGKDLTFNLQQQVRDWITDTITFNESSGDESAAPKIEELDLSGGSMFEQITSEWQVLKKGDLKLSFESFNDVRLAVEEGKIVRGDIIVSSGGIQHPVETYPGTADLFGNSRNLSASQVNALHKKKKGSLRKNIPSIPAILTAAALAGSIVSPLVYQRYKTMKGSRVVESAIAQSKTLAPKLSPSELINEVRTVLIKRQNKLFEESAQNLTAAYKKHPDQTELLAYLGIFWSELGKIDRKGYYAENAPFVISYVKELQPMSSIPPVALGINTYLFKSKEKGLKLIQKASEKELYASLISATFLQSSSELEAAGQILFSAYEKDSGNKLVLEALLESMEKQSKIKEAIGYTKKLVSYFPDDTIYAAKLKSLLEKFGDFDGLEDLLKQEIQTSKAPEVPHLELIRLLKNQKKHDRVIRESQDYLAAYPDSIKANTVRGIFAEAETATLESPNSTDANRRPRSTEEQPSQTPRKRRRRG